MKDWEAVADNLKKAGLSSGWVSALDLEGRTIWMVDGHRGDGKRFVVRADEKLTTFLELESAIRREKLERRPKSQPYIRKSKIGSKGRGNRSNLISEP
jgi:hypothetical protein